MASKNDELRIKAILDTQEFDTSLESMKQEFSALEKKLGSSLLSQADQKAVLSRMGTLKKEIDGFTLQIDALGKQSGFETLVQATTPLVGGFTAAASALQLFGVENEKLNEIVRKTQALTIGLLAVQDLSNLKQLKGLVALKAEKIANYVVDQLTFKNTVKQTAANTAEAGTKGLVATVTALATRAQLAWNAALAANPIGSIIAGVAALIAGIILLVSWLGNSTDEFKQQKEAIDGTKFANDELLERYNEHVVALQNLDKEYKVIMGTMSEFEKSLADIDDALANNINEIENSYIPQLNELAESYSSFWNQVWVGIKGAVIGTQAALLQEAESYGTEYGKITKEMNDEIADKTEEAEKKKANIIINQEKKTNEQIKQLNKKRLEAVENSKIQEFKILSTNLKKEVEAYRKYQTDILDILQDTSEKQKDIDFELATFGLDEYNKALAELNKQSADFVDENIELGKRIAGIPDEAKAKVDQMNTSLGKLEEKLQEIRSFTALDDLIADANDRTIELNKQFQDSVDAVKQVEDALTTIGGSTGDWGEEQKKVGVTQASILALELKLLETKKISGDQVQLYSAVLAEQAQRQQDLVDNQVLVYDLEQKRAQQLVTEGELVQGIKELKQDIKLLEIENGKLTQVEKDKALALNNFQQKLVKLKLDQLRTQKLINDELRRTENLAQLADLEAEAQRRKTDALKGYVDFSIKSQKDLEQERLNIQKEKLDEFYLYRINKALNEGDTAGADILTEQWNAEMDAMETTFNDRWDGFSANVRDSIADMSGMIANAVLDIFTRDVADKFSLLNDRLQKEQETAQNSLDILRDSNLINEEEYEARSLAIAEEGARKERDLKIKQAQAEKRLAIFQIIIDTAIAVAKSWGQGGGLLGAPLAAIAAASGAIQVGLVASQPIPEYAQGGKIGGRRHAFGGSMVEAEQGEFVVNRNSVAQPGVEALLSMINKNGNNSSGSQYNPSDGSTDANVIQQIVSETIKGISSIPVTNLESEYSGVQRKVKSIETRASW